MVKYTITSVVGGNKEYTSKNAMVKYACAKARELPHKNIAYIQIESATFNCRVHYDYRADTYPIYDMSGLVPKFGYADPITGQIKYR